MTVQLAEAMVMTGALREWRGGVSTGWEKTSRIIANTVILDFKFQLIFQRVQLLREHQYEFGKTELRIGTLQHMPFASGCKNQVALHKLTKRVITPAMEEELFLRQPVKGGPQVAACRGELSPMQQVP